MDKEAKNKQHNDLDDVLLPAINMWENHSATHFEDSFEAWKFELESLRTHSAVSLYPTLNLKFLIKFIVAMFVLFCYFWLAQDFVRNFNLENYIIYDAKI